MLTFWAYTIIFFIINHYIATVRSVLKLQNAVKLKKMLMLIIIKHFQLYIDFDIETSMIEILAFSQIQTQ